MRVIGAVRSSLTHPLPLRGRGVVGVLLLLFSICAHATPSPDRLAVLQRGISITAWFRYPASTNPADLRAYLPDTAMARLRRQGFTFVRLPVDTAFLRGAPDRTALLVQAIRRLQRAGLGVLVDAHPTTWRLETSPSDRAALFAFWRGLGPALRPLDPRLTFVELLNEPVFAHAPDAWQALQADLLRMVRATLPQNTIVLTGNDWGSIAGLLASAPAVDANVVYGFHFYAPAELTSLAAYRPGLDRQRLAHLPFPATAPDCNDSTAATDPDTAGLIRFYCAQHWDAGRIAAAIAPAAAWARRNHAAVLLGEFGASAALAPAVRAAWLRAVRDACAANGIGWALWGYDDVMGFNLPRPAGPRPRLDPALLQALGLNAAP